MNKYPDHCIDCREGRSTFQEVIDIIIERKTKGDIPKSTRSPEKMIADFQEAIEKPSNCGNPRCPNLMVAKR